MPRMKVKGVSSMFGRFRVWFWHCPACHLASAAHRGCHEANNAAIFHAGGCEWLRRRVVRRHRCPLTKLDGMVA